MRMLRSSIAFCAMALMAGAFMTMPASAAVPVDPGIHAASAQGICHPSSAILDVDHVAITADRKVDTASSHILIRSTPTLQTAGVAPTEDVLKAAAAEAEKMIDKVETAIEPAKAAVGIPVFNAVQALVQIVGAVSAPIVSAAPVTVSSTDATLVKDLLGIAARLPASFDALAVLAKKSA